MVTFQSGYCLHQPIMLENNKAQEYQTVRYATNRLPAAICPLPRCHPDPNRHNSRHGYRRHNRVTGSWPQIPGPDQHGWTSAYAPTSADTARESHAYRPANRRRTPTLPNWDSFAPRRNRADPPRNADRGKYTTK